MNTVTVAIPSFNAVKYLPYIMERLQMQKIPNLPCVIWDVGSVDGTKALVGNWQATGYTQRKAQEQNAVLLNYFSGSQDNSKHPWQRVYKTRREISEVVKTEFIFFLDPDVLIRQMTIFRLMNEIIEKPECAFIGVKYEDTLDHPVYKDKRHIMAGATLWRKAVFDKLPTEMSEFELNKYGCDCNFQRAEVEKLGFYGVHSETMYFAEHLKGVFT